MLIPPDPPHSCDLPESQQGSIMVCDCGKAYYAWDRAYQLIRLRSGYATYKYRTKWKRIRWYHFGLRRRIKNHKENNEA